MKFISFSLLKFSLLAVLLLPGCSASSVPSGATTLIEARRGFQTTLTPLKSSKEPVERAPEAVFRTIKYEAPVGSLAAYLSPDPGDGKKHPAIIWITGGDCNSIGDVWEKRGVQTIRLQQRIGKRV